MKPEEIAIKYTLDEGGSKETTGDIKSITPSGTTQSLLDYLNTLFLQNEDILDPLKKGPRKTAATFLRTVKLLNPTPKDNNEKLFFACLLTPDSIQPRSRNDKERLVKMQGLLKKGCLWLDSRIAAKKLVKEPNPDSGA